MSQGYVSAIVLAAGESRRMGTLKPLLPYGSTTVIQTVVRSLSASPVDRVLVVLGHRSDEIAAALAGEQATCLVNRRYPEGMLTSVQAGLAAAPPETDRFVIALGDQPWVRPSLVEHLLREADDPERAGLVVPSYAGRRGHPLVIDARFKAEVLALDPKEGLRALMRRYPDAIRHVTVGDPAVLEDMDTPEQYAEALRRSS